MRNSSLTGAKPQATMCVGGNAIMNDSYQTKFVRTHRHRPRVVYSIHQPVQWAGGEDENASVTSQSGTALKLLGQACLKPLGSARTPYLVAHVEYGFNRFATHPKPDNFQATFSLAEFAAHHSQWKKEITEYDITNQMVEGG